MQDPKKTFRQLVLLMAGLAFAIFALIASIAGYVTWSKYAHSRDWIAATATVAGHEVLCQVERKSNRSWTDVVLTDCEEAARIVAERGGLLTPYRSKEVRHALLDYEADGAPRRKSVAVGAFDGADGPAGSPVRIFVNPADANDIDEPWSAGDLSLLWFMLAFAAGLAALVLLIGVGVAWLQYRNATRRMALATALAASSGRASAPVAASFGRPAASPPPPVWARVLGWSGAIVLVLGLAFGVVAAAGGVTSGDSSPITGGAIVAVVALLIFLALRSISRTAGRRG